MHVNQVSSNRNIKTSCVIIACCPATHAHVLTFGGVNRFLG